MDMIRILAVDDEPDLRSLLRILLKNKGYDVLEAASGQEADRVNSRTFSNSSICLGYLRQVSQKASSPKAVYISHKFCSFKKAQRLPGF